MTLTIPILAALGIAEIMIILFILIIPFGLVIYTIIDIVRSNFRDNNSRLLFLILVLFVPFIGSILYFILKNKYIEPSTNLNQFPKA